MQRSNTSHCEEVSFHVSPLLCSVSQLEIGLLQCRCVVCAYLLDDRLPLKHFDNTVYTLVNNLRESAKFNTEIFDEKK